MGAMTEQFAEQVAEQLRRRGLTAVVDEDQDGPTVHAGERSTWPTTGGVRYRAVLLAVDAHYADEDLARYEPDREPPSRLSFASHDDERDGEFVAAGATPEQVAERMAALVHRVEGQRHRLNLAAEQATEAMWGGVVKAYPEVTTGEFGPGETIELEQMIRGMLTLWLIYNRPAEGIAATKEAAAEIVAARRDAAIDRIHPMVTVVREADPDALCDLIHETLQDDAARRAAGYDNKVHPDWLVWSAIYERAATMHEQATTARAGDVAALLVDHLGEYRTIKALIQVGRGELCDGRTPDRDLCGDHTLDRGKCGRHADQAERGN